MFWSQTLWACSKENRLLVNSNLIICFLSDPRKGSRTKDSVFRWVLVLGESHLATPRWDDLTHSWKRTRSKSDNCMCILNWRDSAVTRDVSTQPNRSITTAWPAPGERGVLGLLGHFPSRAFCCAGFVSVICAYSALGLGHSNRRWYIAKPENWSQIRTMVWKLGQLRFRVVSKLFPRWPRGSEFNCLNWINCSWISLVSLAPLL